MNDTRHFLLFAVTIILVVPCIAQEQPSSQATPDLSGTGNSGRIAVWKSSSTLGSSVISQSSGSIGIGTKTPVATLEVNGNAQVDGNFSLSGSVLLTGAGQLIWAPNDGSFNFSAGLDALPSTTTGTQNTAVGDLVLAANTNGSANTAVGTGALASNMTGGANIAVGDAALYLNTVGSSNTAVGQAALRANTEGNQNTAIGQFSLLANTTGNGNTGLGYGSLLNTAGSNNTAMGSNALAVNATGSNNIAIGYNAGFGLTSTTSNNIHIGSQGALSDTGAIRIGCTSTSDCVSGAVPQTSTFIAGIYAVNTGGIPVYINSNGQLGTVSSSRRYKEDIHDMADSSDGLMQLRPVTFRYKKSYEDGSKPVQYGLIAEEVADVYPDLVARSADGQVESVRYQLLDPMLLNEVQKQHATIDAQKGQIRSLEERLARIESMLTAGASGAAGQ